MSFLIDCEEGMDEQALRAVERTMEEFVVADLPVAVELVFVDEAEIRRLNGQTRGVDRVTDVLSYPTMDGIKGKPLKGKEHPLEIVDGALLIGSIVVCKQRAKEQAEEYGHSYERELHYLLVHGIMHCLGYDHERDEDKREMREKEEAVLGKLGITREVAKA